MKKKIASPSLLPLVCGFMVVVIFETPVGVF